MFFDALVQHIKSYKYT